MWEIRIEQSHQQSMSRVDMLLCRWYIIWNAIYWLVGVMFKFIAFMTRRKLSAYKAFLRK